DEGADAFFGEPAFNIMDFFTPASDGRGMINVLNATELFNKPLLYSTFLLWLMSELNENLPDIIYFEKPKMVFFFDEAQLLFSGLSSELNRRIEMMLRKLKDKGIGVYFLVDTPCTFPDNIQSHLQNRIIHAIHAYTPAEIKKATTAVQYLRPNPALTSKDILSQLTDDEAIVSFLDRNGVPSMAERVFILPPQSFIGPAGSEKIQELTNANPLYEKYRDDFDPESAYEILLAKYASNGFNSTYNAQERRAEERERKEELRLQKEQERLEEQDRRIIEMENKLFYRELRDSSRQEDRERLIEEKERAAEIREQRERERQNDRERREAERQARAEERARREAERQRLQLERSLERYQDFNGDPAQRFKSREIGDSLVRGSFDNKKNT
ncbi:MAG: DUF853 family protein, partial [Clostridiales bacterium]|nr:DUF853 family protein [Clostridiales bacterium]